MEKVTRYTRRMAVVYETETPHATRSELGPYREADYVGILSPATARRDLGEKLRLYAESGVAEYWIVDPTLETFEFLENTPAGFRVRLPEGAIYHSAAIPGLELDLEVFWRALPS